MTPLLWKDELRGARNDTHNVRTCFKNFSSNNRGVHAKRHERNLSALNYRECGVFALAYLSMQVEFRLAYIMRLSLIYVHTSLHQQWRHQHLNLFFGERYI